MKNKQQKTCRYFSVTAGSLLAVIFYQGRGKISPLGQEGFLHLVNYADSMGCFTDSAPIVSGEVEFGGDVSPRVIDLSLTK